jgi:lysophospholipase L1-like esterase
MKSVFVIGDSISIHYGPYLKAYLKNRYGYSRKTGKDGLIDLDEPKGANGGDSSMVLEYLLREAESGNAVLGRPDFLLLNCGLHDIKTDTASGSKQVPIEQYRKNLGGIIGAATKAAAHVVWIRTTPVDDKTHQSYGKSFNRYNRDVIRYNEAADEVMQESSVPAIDLYTFTINIEENRYTDHVHFTEPVRQKQAAYIAGWIAGYHRGNGRE